MDPVPFLRRGSGRDPSDGGCIMQIVDWISTNGWTDMPQCVHPRIRAAAISYNDLAHEEERQRLITLVPRFLNASERGIDCDQAIVQAELRGHLWLEGLAELLGDEASEYREAMWNLLLALLDVHEEHFPRTTADKVDYTAVCAVMAA